jgi:nitrate reductase gamma subunit
VIILSALVAHVGWHWMVDRAAVLSRVGWPELDAGAVMTLARWVAGILIVAGAATWLARRLSRRAERADAS